LHPLPTTMKALNFIKAMIGWTCSSVRNVCRNCIWKTKKHRNENVILTNFEIMPISCLIDWWIDWFALGSSPSSPHAPRPYRWALCAP
jgi:hypothetical protein